MSEVLNGDLGIRAKADTRSMDWSPSPSGTVWRKRVHLVGPPESGQVTSVVRYEPDSHFPAHDHPDGEEILVLEGVFSDEHGDWPAGTYLLNPEGFRHAPFSREGCVLFVKLRQFSGRDRQHVVVDTRATGWEATDRDSVMRMPLYEQSGYADTMCLEQWSAGAQLGEIRYAGGVELFVVDGEFSDESGAYPQGSWLRLPVGATHRPQSAGGCTVYVKRAGLAGLTSESELKGTSGSA